MRMSRRDKAGRSSRCQVLKISLALLLLRDAVNKNILTFSESASRLGDRHSRQQPRRVVVGAAGRTWVKVPWSSSVRETEP